jgi:type II secretory pathway component PulM
MSVQACLRLASTCTVQHSLARVLLVLPLLLLQCPLQQVTHAQIYSLQQQLNQAVSVKQQDIQEVYQVRGQAPAAVICQ